MRSDPARLVIREDSAHDITWARIVRLPFPLYPREFVSRQLCFVDSNGDFVMVVAPAGLKPDYGVKTSTVRARAKQAK